MPKKRGPSSKYRDSFSLIRDGFDVLDLINSGTDNNAAIGKALGKDSAQVNRLLSPLRKWNLISQALPSDKFTTAKLTLTERGRAMHRLLVTLDYKKIDGDIMTILGKFDELTTKDEDSLAKPIAELESKNGHRDLIYPMWDLTKAVGALQAKGARWYASEKLFDYLKKVPCGSLTNGPKRLAINILRDAILASRLDVEWNKKYYEMFNDLSSLLEPGSDDDIRLAAFYAIREYRDDGKIPNAIFEIVMEMLWHNAKPDELDALYDSNVIVETLVAMKADLSLDQVAALKKIPSCIDAGKVEEFMVCVNKGETPSSKRPIDGTRVKIIVHELSQFD